MGKAWERKSKISLRNTQTRSIKNTFLIYCEGVVTEPEYFKSFPVNTETHVFSKGFGRSKTSLVEKTIQELSKALFLKGQAQYDPDRQIWVVFDMDYKGRDEDYKDFDKAIVIAKENQLQVAYSNDAFELWFVLHEKLWTPTCTRKIFYEELSKKFGFNYEKKGKGVEFAKTLYNTFLKDQHTAIKNAEKLFKTQKHLRPSQQNPCTLVYELVEELNKCLKP